MHCHVTNAKPTQRSPTTSVVAVSINRVASRNAKSSRASPHTSYTPFGSSFRYRIVLQVLALQERSRCHCSDIPSSWLSDTQNDRNANAGAQRFVRLRPHHLHIHISSQFRIVLSLHSMSKDLWRTISGICLVRSEIRQVGYTP